MCSVGEVPGTCLGIPDLHSFTILQLKFDSLSMIGNVIYKAPKFTQIIEIFLYLFLRDFSLSLEQLWKNFALYHLLTNGSSAVKGWHQNESPNS